MTYAFVMTSLNFLSNWKYDKTNWRLFIDPSKDNIKAVLLHNGNTLPSVCVTYSTTMNESSENLKAILTSIQYDDHNRHICADFKAVAKMYFQPT